MIIYKTKRWSKMDFYFLFLIFSPESTKAVLILLQPTLATQIQLQSFVNMFRQYILMEWIS